MGGTETPELVRTAGTSFGAFGSCYPATQLLGPHVSPGIMLRKLVCSFQICAGYFFFMKRYHQSNKASWNWLLLYLASSQLGTVMLCTHILVSLCYLRKCELTVKNSLPVLEAAQQGHLPSKLTKVK